MQLTHARTRREHKGPPSKSIVRENPPCRRYAPAMSSPPVPAPAAAEAGDDPLDYANAAPEDLLDWSFAAFKRPPTSTLPVVAVSSPMR